MSLRIASTRLIASVAVSALARCMTQGCNSLRVRTCGFNAGSVDSDSDFLAGTALARCEKSSKMLGRKRGSDSIIA